MEFLTELNLGYAKSGISVGHPHRMYWVSNWLLDSVSKEWYKIGDNQCIDGVERHEAWWIYMEEVQGLNPGTTHY